MKELIILFYLDFMVFFGTIYIVSSICILFLKQESLNKEKEDEELDKNKLSLGESYKIVWKIMCIKPIHKLIFILFTLRISFATESMSFLKFVEAGVPKEKLGLLAVPLSPLQVLLPLLISRYLNGKNPFQFFKISVFLRYFDCFFLYKKHKFLYNIIFEKINDDCFVFWSCQDYTLFQIRK
jgi:hypothetical protein